jgi:hypothetical protein
VKLVCAAAAAGLILSFISSIVIDGRNSITGNTMRDFYAQERMDLVFLGSSTVYESCVPDVFDAKMGVSSFNAATPAQTLRESYYQLKEAYRLYRPKRVMLGVGPERVMDPIGRDSLSASYLFDNMRWSSVKLEFLIDAFTPDDYPSALFPAVRLREELTAEDLKAGAKGFWAELAGRTQTLVSEQLRYVGKGYVANLEVIEDGVLPEAPVLGFSGPGSAAPDALAYLSKIVRFCAENDVALTLFQTPLLPGATAWVGDYAAYHDFIADYAERAGVGFMDFNYLKPGIITYEDGMFSDLEHVTEAFAGEFSGVFAGLAASDDAVGAAARNEFFTAYDEYLDRYDAVASTWVTATEGGARAASVGTATPEYRIAVLRDDEEMEEVYRTAWQTDEKAEFPSLAPGDYLVTVEARPRGDEDASPKRNWADLRVD